MWDALTGELQLKFQPEHTAPITAVVVSNTGRHILTGSRDGTVKRFDVRADEGAVFAAAAKALEPSTVGATSVLHSAVLQELQGWTE